MTRQLVIAVCVRSITFDSPAGGLERAAADHVRGLAASGIRVFLLTPAAQIAGVPRGVEVVDVPWPRWSTKRGPLFSSAYAVWLRRARATVRTLSFDVLHLHGAAAGIQTTRSRWTSVANPHGMEEFARGSAIRRISRYPIRRLARRAKLADVVVATDEALVSPVFENLGLDSAQLRVIPNAVDVSRLRDLAGLQTFDRFTVVTVGRLVPNKGYDLLVNAFREKAVRAAMPSEWQWVHFGSGGERDRLLSIAQDADVPLEIREGRDDLEVQSAISSSDLFVQPSRYEGSSLTTLEAMAHGALIVATPVGGIPDKVTDGLTGFLATSVSAEGLSDAVVRALCADGAAIRSAAHARVSSDFDLRAATARYVQLYSDLAGAIG